MTRYDAVVVGSGPNGLAAAITLAQQRKSVLVLEAEQTPGGGLRSRELTLPGYVHDVCAAIVPLCIASPFFRQTPLANFGLEMIWPPVSVAHPFDDGSAASLERSVERTALGLGPDQAVYRRLMAPLAKSAHEVVDDLLGPLRVPRHPLSFGRFGLLAALPASLLARVAFRGPHARGLLAGLSAHSMLPLDAPITAGFGLTLGMLGHAVGWPMARGGTQRIADALVDYLRSLGGEVRTGVRVEALDDLPDHGAALLDLTPRQVLSVAGSVLPARYRRLLASYRYGLGVFKIDWALDGPIPWTAEACSRAGTVHLGGTMDEVEASERAAWAGQHAAQPFVLLVQPSLFDPSRAPNGGHTAWAYCHVPHGSAQDRTDAIEDQVERFAPGFRQRIVARSTLNSVDLQHYNANYIGGDINGGVQDLAQMWTRPAARVVPYSTPHPGVFVCSSSTPPGGGVHGMCGVHAAHAALRRLRL